MSRVPSFASLLLLAVSAAAVSAACTTTDGVESSDEFALMVDRVKKIEPIELDKLVTGKFERSVRTYGFSFEAKAGATIKVDLGVKAGTNAAELAAGSALDTVAAIYGPVTKTSKGNQLAFSDDGPTGSNAQLPALKIIEDGTYLIVLSAWDDPGTDGSFELKASCNGTEFQCKKPVKPNCVDGTRYIQGGTVIGTETWNQCEIVLLEEVHVAEGAVLTIQPGVTVKGNFLGSGPFGSIGLVVDGTLQAVGTAEHPVVFTSLKDGWKGLTLKGNSNTLDHVYVERAATGVEIRGSNNTLANLNVNSGNLGIHFAENSKDNRVEHVHVSKIDRAILFSQGSSAILDDAILLGKEDGAGIGIEANNGEMSQFRRALVAGFGDGLLLNATALEVTDGTITRNTRGVTMTGPNPGVNPPYPACPSTDWPSPPPPPPSPPVTYYRRDPVFIRCDITRNTTHAIRVEAPELLVVEESNLKDNGTGVAIHADGLNAESRIVRSNVYNNGPATVQIESWHREGTLNISGNFWKHISDPELSASWSLQHSATTTCKAAGCGTRTCGSTYTCTSQNYRGGPQGTTYYWDNCTAPHSTTWTGALTFTGFSPRELPAGPREGVLSDDVKKERELQRSR